MTEGRNQFLCYPDGASRGFSGCASRDYNWAGRGRSLRPGGGSARQIPGQGGGGVPGGLVFHCSCPGGAGVRRPKAVHQVGELPSPEVEGDTGHENV